MTARMNAGLPGVWRLSVLTASSIGNCLRRIDVHLAEHLPDGGHKRSYVLREYVSHGANTETICIAHFARIDDEAEFAQPAVKTGEVKTGMRREAERCNEVALVFGGKIRIEA